MVRGVDDGVKVTATRAKQLHQFAGFEFVTRFVASEQCRHGTAALGGRWRSRRRDVGAGEPLVVAREKAGVRVGEHVRTNLGVEERRRKTNELGVHRQARAERETTVVALGAESRDRGPGPLGVHVILGHR